MTKIAIIGTAGRDKTKPMTRALWNWMCADAIQRVPREAHLVSGGAAWADHLAVYLFLSGRASELTLYLPAPFHDAEFIGPRNSAASAAMYYHELFARAINEPTLRQLEAAVDKPNCHGECEPAAPGYAAMFARNKKVARDADEMIAYTFGPGDAPADGGTSHTWGMHIQAHPDGRRTHVSLPIVR